MTEDRAHAAVLRHILHDRPGLVTRERAAIERAIELLEREAKYGKRPTDLTEA